MHAKLQIWLMALVWCGLVLKPSISFCDCHISNFKLSIQLFRLESIRVGSTGTGTRRTARMSTFWIVLARYHLFEIDLSVKGCTRINMLLCVKPNFPVCRLACRTLKHNYHIAWLGENTSQSSGWYKQTHTHVIYAYVGDKADFDVYLTCFFIMFVSICGQRDHQTRTAKIWGEKRSTPAFMISLLN